MTFEDILVQAVAILHRRRRVTYRALQAQFQLDDDLLKILKDELLFSYSAVTDEDNRGLVWIGDIPNPEKNPQHETDGERLFLKTILFKYHKMLDQYKNFQITYFERLVPVVRDFYRSHARNRLLERREREKGPADLMSVSVPTP